MHYPTTIDVQYIIDYALYLKYPNNYSKPISNMFYENKQTSEKSLQETVKNQAKKRYI